MKKCMWPPCPNESDSREHLLPDWLNRVVPSGNHIRWEAEESHAGVERTYRLQAPAVRKELTVCDACNTQWMSAVENDAKPVLEPMILGKPTTLSQTDQLLVATWATMRAYVWEEITGARVSTEEDRDVIYRQRRPSANTRVRLAAFHVAPNKFPFHVNNYPVRVNDGGSYVAYACTIILGRLVIQVLGRPSSAYRAFENLGVADAATIMILPPIFAGASWPPPSAMDASALEVFIREPFPDLPRAAGPIQDLDPTDRAAK